MSKCSWVLILALGWGCQGGRGTGDSHRTFLEQPQVEAIPLAPAELAARSHSVAPGVVVENVPDDSALGKAGIQSGDVLLSWVRLMTPPANPESAEGEFHSPFDWHGLRLEQAPRGTVGISGQRGGVEKKWRIKPGSWRGVGVRPRWIGDHLELYREGQQQIEDWNPGEGANSWLELIGRLGGDEDRLKLWVHFESVLSWLVADGEPTWGGEELDRILVLYNTQTAHALESAYIQHKFGEVFRKRGDLDRAQDLCSRAFKIRERLIPQSLTVASSLQELGIVSWSSGDLNQAEELHTRGLQIREQLAPASLAVASSLNNLGIVAWERGLLDRAQEFFTRGLVIREQLAPGSLDVAGSLNNLGLLATERGDLDQAQKFFIPALQIFEQLAPGGLYVATILNNLGNVAKNRGYLDQAQEFFTRALRLRMQLAPGGLEVAASLNNLGTVASDRGDLQQAQDFFTRALKLLEERAPGSLHVAGSLNNLGTLATDRGDLDRAQELLTRAFRIKQQFAPGSLEVATSLKNLGDVSMNRGDLDQAQILYSRALRIEEQGAPGSLKLSTSLHRLGDLAGNRGDLEQADGFYRRALQIRQQLAPQSLDTANSLNSLADVKLAQGDSDGAVTQYLQALEVLEKQIRNLGGSYGVQADFRAQQREYYREALELLLTQERLTEAFHILERFRARTFLTMLAEKDILFKADLPEKLDRERRRLAVRYDRTVKRLAGLSAQEDGEKVTAIRRALEAMDHERGELEERIRQASPQLAALQYPRPLTVEAAQKTLDPGTLLVSYVVGEESTSIFILSKEEILEVETAFVGEGVLREKIENLRKLISGPFPDTQLGRGRTRSFRILSRELYELLLEPVAARIKKSHRLLILADGPLHALPFAALIREDGDGDGGDAGNDQYLVAWKPLHIALSMTAYEELKKARPSVQESEATPARLVAFGDPSYPESFTPATVDRQAAFLPQDAVLRSVSEREGIDFKWLRLPYTRHEVESIAELFPLGQAQVFLGSEALEERVKNLGSGVRILHLAAHAFTDDRLPLSSFVALTIPEDLPDGRDNGLLQAWEILEQVRLDADLVVLSGCLTGMGQELRGEGLIGLTRAFQYAGARSMMSTLWSVSDQATAELMVRFYRHLRSGLPKDEALRAAQLELLREPIVSIDEDGRPEKLENASAPYHWAGVQLYGDWR